MTARRIFCQTRQALYEKKDRRRHTLSVRTLQESELFFFALHTADKHGPYADRSAAATLNQHRAGDEIKMNIVNVFQKLLCLCVCASVPIGGIADRLPSGSDKPKNAVFCASDGSVCNWYCAHQKDHVQPRADAALSFVETHGGYYVDHRHTVPDAEDKVVYLTFDAGYENGNVARVLDALRDEGVPGAFFILGHVAEKYPDLVRRMADEGHLVCNHTFTHKALTGTSPEAVAAELGRLEKACRDSAGVTVAKYFRPPEGKFDAALLDSASALGYKTIFWSFAYADWDNARQPDPARAKQKILENIHNGEVMLLHPTSATNAAVLGDVIRALKAEGYRFGTLDELTEPDNAIKGN